MKNHLKKTENHTTNQGLHLENLIRRVSIINGALFTLGIINFLVLTYFYIQQDIIFCATGWLPIPENIHWWYYIFLLLIVVRMLIVLTTRYFAEYIKNFSLWTEEKKKNALYALAVINLLTLPINLPLIGSFYAYIKGSEILSNNLFLGTFRRILNENERYKLYQETIQNFIEKTEASKEIKDQLKNWTIENTKSILEKYDDGSAIATEYLSEKLEIQKEFLQREEIKNHNQAIKVDDVVDNIVDKTGNNIQKLFSWMYDQTINGLNYFNPFVTEPKTCAIAWAFLLGTGFLIFAVYQSNLSIQNEFKYLNSISDSTSDSAKRQEHLMNTLRMVIGDQDRRLAKLERAGVTENKSAQTVLETAQELRSEITSVQGIFHNVMQNQMQNKAVNIIMKEQMRDAQEKINMLIRKMANPRSDILPPYSARGLPAPYNLLTQDDKNRILTNIFKKYEKESITMKTVQEMVRDAVTQIL